MLHYFIQLLVTAVSVLVAARIIPGIRVRSFSSALFFALVLSLLNVFFGLLVLVTLPVVVLTLGLFMLVINGFLFWLADKIVDGVEVDGFLACVLGSLVTSLASWGIMMLLRSVH